MQISFRVSAMQLINRPHDCLSNFNIAHMTEIFFMSGLLWLIMHCAELRVSADGSGDYLQEPLPKFTASLHQAQVPLGLAKAPIFSCW